MTIVRKSLPLYRNTNVLKRVFLYPRHVSITKDIWKFNKLCGKALREKVVMGLLAETFD